MVCNSRKILVSLAGVFCMSATGLLSTGVPGTVPVAAAVSSSSSSSPGGETLVPDPGTDVPDSHVHQKMGWQPTEFDTCPKELHDSFMVTGPDGKRYETWHPPTGEDPVTGVNCTFGHEHGDDPRTSDIYDFVVDKLAAPGDKDRAGLPFGFTGEASTIYAEESGAGLAHRHEDHVGHKVFVLNDVQLRDADRTQGYVRDDSGAPVVCDYLMKFHQGTHSSDATKNNAHEIIYGARCSDGTEMVVSHLTKLGNPNEFTQVCSDKVITTAGSDLPPNPDGGRRRIPDLECLQNSDDVWATYETWETVSRIETADGRTLAAFDPWFGVRNPSRYFDNRAADLADGTRPLVELVDLFDDLNWPWSEVTPGMEKNDPASPFNGAQRDTYVAETRVDNGDGPTTWYTDPYGGNASREPFPGSVRQYISDTSNLHLPELERQAFGFSRDYGDADTGVHAPN